MESEGNDIEINVDKSLEFQITKQNISNFHNYGLQSSEITSVLSNENDDSSRTFKVEESYVCPECKHAFRYLKNFRRHVRTKHPTLFHALFSDKKFYKGNDKEKTFKCIKSNPKQSFENEAKQTFENAAELSNKDFNPIIFKIGESYLCPECNITFSYLKNLKRHVNKKHPCLSITLFPPIKYAHKCNICEKTFKSKSTLQFHKHRIHNTLKRTIIKKHKCPLCSESFRRRNFVEHFEKNHNLPLKPVKINFGSYQDFCEWKAAIERVTKTYFAKHDSNQFNGITRHTFTCHRSGTFSSVSENKRKLKAQGSSKINAFCPAFIKVVVMKEANCEVMFQSKHVGHVNELHHLKLTYDERKFIADKLDTNLSLNDILNDIRSSASVIGSERLCLLTKKDLHNIKSSISKDKQSYMCAATHNEELTSVLRDIHDKHAESEQLNFTDSAKIEKGKGWILTFIEDNEICLIKENLELCDCPLICSYCNVCINAYICTCSDSTVNGNMCKHIHFFCMEKDKIFIRTESDYSVDCNNAITEVVADSTQCGLPQTCNILANTSDSTQCGLTQTSDTLAVSVGELISDNNFVDSEKRNMLIDKFSGLVNAITTKEEYDLFKHTIEELNVKQQTIQNHSKKNDAVISATNRSVPIGGNIKVEHKSSSSKATVTKPLVLELIDPTKLGAQICYIHFAKTT